MNRKESSTSFRITVLQEKNFFVVQGTKKCSQTNTAAENLMSFPRFEGL